MSPNPKISVPLIPVFIISGATATGKSSVAFKLAQRLGACILSADSMQVYRGMEIGTAQPSEAEQALIPNHLVGCVEPNDDYNVARFLADSTKILQQEWSAKRPVIVCGGTGLFLKHLIEGLADVAPMDGKLRQELEAWLAAEGLQALRAELRRVDPQREAQILANDPVRVVRALEIFRATGITMTQWHQLDQQQRTLRPHDYIVLSRPKEILNERIHQRIDQMLQQGWLSEVEQLLTKYPSTTRCFRALGYSQLIDVVQGDRPLAEARDEIKTKTRQFAKRQRTWFRGIKKAHLVDLETADTEELLKELEARYWKIVQSGSCPP
ncbi:MAG: tRNA (adenosine(37)-N6)-dimethylallyltransferase MiaA [Sumerlaeia bacterium]